MRGVRMRVPKLLAHPAFKVAMAVLSVLCAAPSGCGGSGGGPSGTPASVPTPANPTGTTSNNTNPNLTIDDVNAIVLQAIHEANARGAPATIAVVDRGGNVLAVTQM